MLMAFDGQSLAEMEEHWSIEDLAHTTEIFRWKRKLESKAREPKKGRG